MARRRIGGGFEQEPGSQAPPWLQDVVNRQGERAEPGAGAEATYVADLLPRRNALGGAMP
jgi:hypothetical protein